MQTTSHDTTNVAVYEVGQASCHRAIVTYTCLGVVVVLAHFDSVLIFWLKCEFHSKCCIQIVVRRSTETQSLTPPPPTNSEKNLHQADQIVN